jgi:hypothetical protein
MVYAPKSFGWRALLLQGAKVDGENVVQNGEVKEDVLDKYKQKDWHWWNTAGAFLMAIWLWIIFLVVIGFGYSFFWSSITVIYMLMRRIADGAELDEVYLEEDEGEGVFGSPLSAPSPPLSPAPSKPTQPLTMVEPPALRTPPAPAPTPPPAPVTTTPSGTSSESKPDTPPAPSSTPKTGNGEDATPPL